MNDTTKEKTYEDTLRGRRTAAGVLVVVALAALAGPYVPFSWRDSFLVLMGVAFMVWAALVRSPGLLVPGGVLTGVGVGTLLRPEFGNGAFLLSMSGGFLVIAGLSRLLFARTKGCVWPFWPAAGLAFAGLASMGGPETRELLRAVKPLWPFVLIAVAAFLLLTKPARKVWPPAD